MCDECMIIGLPHLYSMMETHSSSDECPNSEYMANSGHQHTNVNHPTHFTHELPFKQVLPNGK